MYTYQLIKNQVTQELADVIKRLPDNAFIPMHEDNRDYQKYLKWVAEGNTPEPAEGTE
jgi:hypothetical protein